MLLKDYDYTIEYYLSKANIVANAFSKKTIGSLTYVHTIFYPLLYALRDIRVKLDID